MTVLAGHDFLSAPPITLGAFSRNIATTLVNRGENAFLLRDKSATSPRQSPQHGSGEKRRSSARQMLRVESCAKPRSKVPPHAEVQVQSSQEEERMQAMVPLRRHYGTTTPPLWYHYAAVLASTDCSSALRSKSRRPPQHVQKQHAIGTPVNCARAFGRVEASLFFPYPALRFRDARQTRTRKAP